MSYTWFTSRMDALATGIGIGFRINGRFKTYLHRPVFCPCVLLSLSAKGYIKAFLSSKILIWFGMISYPLYLFHNLFNGLIHQLFANNLKPKLQNEKDVLLTVIALIVSLLFSHLVHKYLEQPFIAKGKKFKYKLND